MATAPKTLISASTVPRLVDFVSPPNKQLKSFQDLCYNSFERNCPRWKTESCIIPPIFDYKSPDKCDEDFEEAQAVGGFNRLVSDRRSDEAEHLVYKTLYTMVQDGFQAPFIVVHNLNINRIKPHLDKLFPLVTDGWTRFEECMREYDYVIIGPKIGLVVIEVKSSLFTQKSHFAPEKRHLPEDYVKGIRQLQSVDIFLKFLHTCTGTEWPENVPVRKVLLTRNLERQRYHSWLESLSDNDRSHVLEKIKSSEVIQLFAEDFLNVKLKEILQLSRWSSVMDSDIYHSMGPVMVGLASVVIQEKTAPIINIDAAKMSLAAAIMNETSRIEAHDPLNGLRKWPQKIPANHKLVEHHGKAIILTPDQLKVIKAPCKRLIIVGSAGTGKTIILQQTALQLLKSGKKVLILSPAAAVGLYEHFFDSHHIDSNFFSIRQWEEIGDQLDGWLRNQEIQRRNHGLEVLSDANQLYGTEWPKEVLTFMEDFDSVLIDDAGDSDISWLRKSSLKAILVVFALSHRAYKDKTLWAAIDPFGLKYVKLTDINELFVGFQSIVDASTFHPDLNCDGKYCSVLLRKVMRCPETVYYLAYYMVPLCRKDQSKACFIPCMGHKIQGLQFVTKTLRCATFEKAVVAARKELKKQLAILASENIPEENTVIILAGRATGEESVEAKSCYTRGKLKAYFWDRVSSLEWPVAIFVCIETTGQSEDDLYGQKYRACSRATGKAIIITVFYPRSLFDDEKSNQVDMRRILLGERAPWEKEQLGKKLLGMTTKFF